jgi:hypothetical protein
MRVIFLAVMAACLLWFATLFVWPSKLTEAEARSEAISAFNHYADRSSSSPRYLFDGPYPVEGSDPFAYEWKRKIPLLGAFPDYGVEISFMADGDYNVSGLNRPDNVHAMNPAEAAAFRNRVLMLSPIDAVPNILFFGAVAMWVCYLVNGLYHLVASRSAEGAGEVGRISDGGLRGWLWPVIKASAEKPLSAATIHKRRFRRSLAVTLAPVLAVGLFMIGALVFLALGY